MLKGITISQKLYFVVGTMAVLVVVELFALMFCIHTLSSVRAMVGAEGFWSKGQKEAVYYLQKFRLSGNEKDYKKFQKYIAIPLGDHKARLELLKEKRNYDSIRQGFVRGNVHKDDIDGIVSLYERFHTTYYIHRAFKIWSTGDSLLLPKLISLAESLHLEKNSAHPSQEKIDFLMARIDPINQQMTRLEDDFSNILGEGSRWLEALILKILFAIALCVEIIGFALTIYLKKGITKGLNEINTVAHEISLGDYSRRATVFSNDEIGKVAKSINKMTEDLLSQANNLQQNEQRLELVLKAAQLGIWEIDFENNTVWRNLKYDEIFGYTSLQQKWSWRIFLAHVIDEDRRMVWAHFKRARQMGYYNLECRIRGADNLPRWILIEGQAYLNAQNNIVKMAGIVMDISKRKNIEEKVLQSNKEIEQFAFAASHDLQEPLRSISNFTDLLQKQSHNWEDAEANQALHYILKASDRMKKLVHDLLEYARLGDSFKRQSVDLNVLLKDVLKDLEPTIQHHGANISLGELPLVNGSPHDLKLLFNNLISNALLFKKKETVPEIKIDLEGRSREWVIRISDNGLGIEKKYFEKIFVIFQKLHSKNEYPGTGIGLALCKKIVELHGGNIVVESQIGEGSIFSFTLPKAISA